MSSRRILVVEDDAAIREMLSEILTGEGYLIDQAANGRDALLKLKRVRPDDAPGMGFVLHYGRSWSGGVIRCRSRQTGLRCESTVTGHGFYLAREFQRTF